MKLSILGSSTVCSLQHSSCSQVCLWSKTRWSYRWTLGSSWMHPEIFWECILPEHSSSNECNHSIMTMNLWLPSRQNTTKTRGTQSTGCALSVAESKATDELRLCEVELRWVSSAFLIYRRLDRGEQDWDYGHLYSFLAETNREISISTQNIGLYIFNSSYSSLDKCKILTLIIIWDDLQEAQIVLFWIATLLRNHSQPW